MTTRNDRLARGECSVDLGPLLDLLDARERDVQQLQQQLVAVNERLAVRPSRTAVNVVDEFGLVENSHRDAANNRARLQAAIDAGPQRLPWQWQGAASTATAILIDDTLVLPTDSGRCWLGMGGDAPGGTGGGKCLGSHLTLRVTGPEGRGKTIVRNNGLWTRTVGLQFSFRILTKQDAYGSVCYHVATNYGNKVATGKHKFDSCSFGYAADAGILCGRDLTGFRSGDNDWPGRTDNHADSIETDHCNITHCANAILVRNEQSVMHAHRHLAATGITEAVFNFDAGGKLTADSIEIAGWSGSQCLLRLGKGVASNNSPFEVTGVSFDGGDNTRNPQLVVTDWLGRYAQARIDIRGVCLNRAKEHDDLPLVDVQSMTDVRISGVSGTPIWPGSLLLRESGGKKPFLLIDFSYVAYKDNPRELLHPACSPGCVVELRNCRRWGEDYVPHTRIVVGEGEA
jgi:hypothetical protein